MLDPEGFHQVSNLIDLGCSRLERTNTDKSDPVSPIDCPVDMVRRFASCVLKM